MKPGGPAGANRQAGPHVPLDEQGRQPTPLSLVRQSLATPKRLNNGSAER